MSNKKTLKDYAKESNCTGNEQFVELACFPERTLSRWCKSKPDAMDVIARGVKNKVLELVRGE